MASQSKGQRRPTVDVHLPCAGCGYDLFGAPRDLRCPECGHSIAPSLDPTRLFFSPRWLVWLLLLGLGFNILSFAPPLFLNVAMMILEVSQLARIFEQIPPWLDWVFIPPWVWAIAICAACQMRTRTIVVAVFLLALASSFLLLTTSDGRASIHGGRLHLLGMVEVSEDFLQLCAGAITFIPYLLVAESLSHEGSAMCRTCLVSAAMLTASAAVVNSAMWLAGRNMPYLLGAALTASFLVLPAAALMAMACVVRIRRLQVRFGRMNQSPPS